MNTGGSNHPEIELLQARELQSNICWVCKLCDFSFLEWSFFCISTFTYGKNVSDNSAQMSIISMWNLNVKTALGLTEKECCYNLLCCRPVASSWSSWWSVWSAWSASSSTSPSAPMPWHQAWRETSSWSPDDIKTLSSRLWTVVKSC